MDDRTGLNFRYHILPYIEQENLFPTISRTTLYATPVKVYFCPTRRAPEVRNNSTRCDYNGNAGTDFDNGTARDGSTWGSDRNQVFNGAMVRENVGDVTLGGGIPDGTSNTLMVGEKWLHPRRHFADGGDNENHMNAGWDQCVVRVGGGTYSYPYNNGQPTTADGPRRTIPRTPQPDRDAPLVINSDGTNRTWWNEVFGSSHPGGCQFVLCDGSVRNVRFGIDPAAFAAACTRNGGEVLALD
jgi:prepilin-type processing-associated H-X9-DG protein